MGETRWVSRACWSAKPVAMTDSDRRMLDNSCIEATYFPFIIQIDNGIIFTCVGCIAQ